MFFRAVFLCAVLFFVVQGQQQKQCTVLKHINGCSIPFGLNAPHKAQFTPACNIHDVCYRCGNVAGISRTLCDDYFLRDMRATCSVKAKQQNDPGLLENLVKGWKKVQKYFKIKDEKKRCLYGAELYYEAVETFGAARYITHSFMDYSYCREPCVKDYIKSKIN